MKMYLLAATAALGFATVSAPAHAACDLTALEKQYRDEAAGRPKTPGADPCPDLTGSVQRSQQSAQDRYNAEVKVHGKQAVAECRSRMPPSSPGYNWCLEANTGRR